MIVGLKDKYLVNQNVKPMMGSQGQVFFGVNMNTKEEVAIKLCVLDENEKQFMALYMEKKQQKVPQQLVNIHEIYSQGQNNQFIIIMEKASHGDLQSFMKQTNYLKQIVNTKQVRLQFLKDIAFGVKELHEMDIIHRDLKPENILVFTNQNKQFTCKICDFGLAKKADNAKTQQIGTPFYMAPELLMGESSYTKSVDIWALGCLFYELLSEQTLFNGRAIYDLMKSITQSTNIEIEQKIQNGLKDCGMENMTDLIVKMVKRESSERIEIKDVITEIYSLKGMKIKLQEKSNNQPNQEAHQPQGNATASRIKLREKQTEKSENIGTENISDQQQEIQPIHQEQFDQIEKHFNTQKQEQTDRFERIEQIEEQQNNQMECESWNQMPQKLQKPQKEDYECFTIDNCQEDKNRKISDGKIKEKLNLGFFKIIFNQQYEKISELHYQTIDNISQLGIMKTKEYVKDSVLLGFKQGLVDFKYN